MVTHDRQGCYTWLSAPIAAAVAYWRDRHPRPRPAEIAARVGTSEDTHRIRRTCAPSRAGKRQDTTARRFPTRSALTVGTPAAPRRTSSWTTDSIRSRYLACRRWRSNADRWPVNWPGNCWCFGASSAQAHSRERRPSRAVQPTASQSQRRLTPRTNPTTTVIPAGYLTRCNERSAAVACIRSSCFLIVLEPVRNGRECLLVVGVSRVAVCGGVPG
jgi:hypothetical protein